MNEADVCMKLITPALERAGWDVSAQIFREYFTDGRMRVRGKISKRGKRKRADYVLFGRKGVPVAVIEAKDSEHTIADGMQQALDYAEDLDVPSVFSSNGAGFQFHDRTGLNEKMETTLSMDEFPSLAFLWQRYCEWKGLTDAPHPEIVEQPYHESLDDKTPRYYQRVAINRAIEAVARGQDRILLVMATGTGKTYTAFQIIWRLWKARHKKRILFLADRNILVDQARNNDFAPFGPAMTKITNRTVDKSYEIYLALYQAVTGQEDAQDIYKQFSPDFFDLVVVDECHRGSAREASNWHKILTYFSGATQIGLTATPKETNDISNIGYFGDPVYTYSLRQGIEDGFLAAYRVIRVNLDKDMDGWTPTPGMRDDLGVEIADREYNQRDFDRTLVLNQRTKLVAERVVTELEANDPFAKTIIFCEDRDHADRMRQAIVNTSKERVLEDRRYVVRITGDDQEGKLQLENFIDPEERYPVIATTSQLLTTGVDVRTCKYIVLDKRIESMTEFKQVIGRGTRLYPEGRKFFFTIIDFKGATQKFFDPEFDGDPIPLVDPENHVSGGEETEEESGGGTDETCGGMPPAPPSGEPEGTGTRKYIVSGVAFEVRSEQVMHHGKDGQLITESLKDYTKRGVVKQFRSLDNFLRVWKGEDRKAEIIQRLEEQGVFIECLEEMVIEKVGEGLDPFDLICHVAFDQPPLTRRERALSVKKRDVFTKYGEQARKVLEALLDKYADEGIIAVEKMEVLKVQPFSEMGTLVELVNHFGGRDGYQSALHELEHALYSVQKEEAA